MKSLFCIITALVCSLTHAQVGFKTETLITSNHRPLAVAYWYPTEGQGNSKTFFENSAFYGIEAQENADMSTDTHPLVVISHGFMGNYRNQSWLAVALASRGFVVASPNHPGTTSRNRDKTAGSELWRRPKDLSVIIDHLLTTPEAAGRIDEESIYVIGHSLGAWTALAIAGARFSKQKITETCDKNTHLAGCESYNQLDPASNQTNLQKLESNLSDHRVKGVISLDIGLVNGFTEQSLKSIDIPTLVISAGEPNERIPFELESGALAEALPKDKVTERKLVGGMHFSFLQRCKPNAIKLLESESHGDGIICLDGKGINRKALHQQTIQWILGFLAKIGAPINH